MPEWVQVKTTCAGCGAEFVSDWRLDEFDTEDQERLRRGENIPLEDEYCLSCQAGIDWDVTRDWARR